MADIFRRKQPGEAWETAEFTGGGGGGSPGGSDTQVQFNDSGAFGGDAGFTYDGETAKVRAQSGQSPAILTIADENDDSALSVGADKTVIVGGQFGTAGGFEVTAGGDVDLAGWGEIQADGTTAFFGESMGFFGATPVAQPTGVAVSTAAIHAALVQLGLITA